MCKRWHPVLYLVLTSLLPHKKTYLSFHLYSTSNLQRRSIFSKIPSHRRRRPLVLSNHHHYHHRKVQHRLSSPTKSIPVPHPQSNKSQRHSVVLWQVSLSSYCSSTFASDVVVENQPNPSHLECALLLPLHHLSITRLKCNKWTKTPGPLSPELLLHQAMAPLMRIHPSRCNLLLRTRMILTFNASPLHV